MVDFGLVLGHLVGDYIVQNDWMAQNKTVLFPTDEPPVADGEIGYIENGGRIYGKTSDRLAWEERCFDGWRGMVSCVIHCLFYTLSVWLFSFWWMPWWGLLVCFTCHYPLDRYRLAGWWMKNISGQTQFATGILSPWSIIVVDNIFHLLTLYLISAIHFGYCV